FCFSKGLGAPIGSILCGSADFNEEARRVRVQLTGGWRQAGVIAAAAMVALDEGPGRLHEDHANTKRLAEGLAEIVPGSIDPAAVETNILFVDPSPIGLTPSEAAKRLHAEGVLATLVAGKVRMLTHRDVSTSDIDAALDAWRRIAA
ncbi:MAG: beta-eliminating lyase-related protein, partial [Actinomycetota bacterium]